MFFKHIINELRLKNVHMLDYPIEMVIFVSISSSICYFVWDLILTTMLAEWRNWALLLRWVTDFIELRRPWQHLVASPVFCYFATPILFSLGGMNFLMALNEITGYILPQLWKLFRSQSEDGHWPAYIRRDTFPALCHIGTALLSHHRLLIWRAIVFIFHDAILGPLVTISMFISLLFILQPWLRQYTTIYFRISRAHDRAGIIVSTVLKEIAIWTRLLVSFLATARLQMFQYGNLDQQQSQVRLLRLHHRRAFGLIECQLDPVPLTTAGPFEALSYRWSTGRQIAISLNGKRHMVSITVHTMLRRLQLSDRDRLLWIDSICINQNDIQEKSWQITIMGDTFRRAACVVGWLGDAKATSGALSYLAELQDTAQNAPMDNLLEQVNQHVLLWRLQRRYNPKWRSVIELFRSEWFSRVWIIQEVACAQVMMMKHGDEEISWKSLAGAGELMLLPQFQSCLVETCDLNLWTVDKDMYTAIKGLLVMSAMRHHITNAVNGLDMDALLGCSLDFNSSELKDRVYGLLGLSTNQTRQTIPINYNAADRDVIMLVSRFILFHQQGHSLKYFHLAGDGYAKEPRVRALNLPSWCPDWLSCRSEKPVVEGNRYRAATHLASSINEIPGSLELISVRGTVYDQINQLGKIWKHTNGRDLLHDAGEITTRAEEGRSLAQDASPALYTEDIQDSLWRTILGDFYLDEGPAPAQSLGSLREAFRQARDLSWGRLTSGSFSNEHVPDLGKCLQTLGAMMFGKRLCLTTGGRLGVVPPLAEQGDNICVIFGAQTPFILRPQPHNPIATETNILIGSCYIHGMMLEELLEVEMQPETFILE